MPLKSKTESIYLTPNWRFHQDAQNFVLEHREAAKLKDGTPTEKWTPHYYSSLVAAVPSLLRRDAMAGRTLGEMKTRIEESTRQIIAVIKGQEKKDMTPVLMDATGMTETELQEALSQSDSVPVMSRSVGRRLDAQGARERLADAGGSEPQLQDIPRRRPMFKRNKT